jgi:hypothetical protein
MPIKLECPHCRAKLDVNELMAGQSVTCAGCGKTMKVPGTEPLTMASLGWPAGVVRTIDWLSIASLIVTITILAFSSAPLWVIIVVTASLIVFVLTPVALVARGILNLSSKSKASVATTSTGAAVVEIKGESGGSMFAAVMLFCLGAVTGLGLVGTFFSAMIRTGSSYHVFDFRSDNAYGATANATKAIAQNQPFEFIFWAIAFLLVVIGWKLNSIDQQLRNHFHKKS